MTYRNAAGAGAAGQLGLSLFIGVDDSISDKVLLIVARLHVFGEFNVTYICLQIQ